MIEFRWNDWNLEHASKHGVAFAEAEGVVIDARPPFPEERGDNKWRVIGRGFGGRIIQVIFLVDDDGTVYVIHARPLNDREKRVYRRRIK